MNTPKNPERCAPDSETMARQALLRRALAGNALSCFSFGALMAAAPALVSELLGLEPSLASLPVRAVGVGLLAVAVDFAHQASRPRMSSLRAAVAVISDGAWVLASAALLLGWGELFSARGAGIVAAVAAMVGGFAVAQGLGIRRLLAAGEGSEHSHRHSVTVVVDADADALWAVVADLGGVHRYAQGLRHSELIPGEGDGGARAGVGARRLCEGQGGERWSEQCTAFSANERAFSLRFLTDEEGFPFPVRTMAGGWTVVAAGEGARVEVWWELTPASGTARLMLPVMGAHMDRTTVRILGEMARAARGEALRAGKGGRAPTLAVAC